MSHKVLKFNDFVNEQYDDEVENDNTASLSDLFAAYAEVNHAEERVLIWCTLDDPTVDLTENGIHIVIDPSDSDIEEVQNRPTEAIIFDAGRGEENVSGS